MLNVHSSNLCVIPRSRHGSFGHRSRIRGTVAPSAPGSIAPEGPRGGLAREKLLLAGLRTRPSANRRLKLETGAWNCYPRGRYLAFAEPITEPSGLRLPGNES
jgi:hypothetical protein